jgi:hypothetical protein
MCYRGKTTFSNVTGVKTPNLTQPIYFVSFLILMFCSAVITWLDEFSGAPWLFRTNESKQREETTDRAGSGSWDLRRRREHRYRRESMAVEASPQNRRLVRCSMLRQADTQQNLHCVCTITTVVMVTAGKHTLAPPLVTIPSTRPTTMARKLVRTANVRLERGAEGRRT